MDSYEITNFGIRIFNSRQSFSVSFHTNNIVIEDANGCYVWSIYNATLELRKGVFFIKVRLHGNFITLVMCRLSASDTSALISQWDDFKYFLIIR